mgnify:CR=1 FL=1
MSTTGPTAAPNQGTQRHPVTRTSGGEKPAAVWADGVLVLPLLWLVVMGYQVLVLMLKVVNREKPARPGPSAGGGHAVAVATGPAVTRR